MLQSNEASFYTRNEDGTVHCQLCPHECALQPGQVGRCQVRRHENGRLVTLTYGKVASYGKDPIEKKPLYHFYPGTKIFSVGAFGCNFTCDFCQNHEISQGTSRAIETPPANLVNIATNEKQNLGIAYTYNEPSVWYEFVTDVAAAIRVTGKKNVLVTNGFINPKPLEKWLDIMDAVNIDLKSIDEKTYQAVCGGRIEPVLDSIRMWATRAHVEITTLLIEGVNTSEEEIDRLAAFVASVNPSIPLHLSRFFPAYKRQTPPTSEATMVRLQAVAQRHLPFVYLGNMPEHNRNTYCPHCGALWIERGEGVQVHLTQDSHCSQCGAAASIPWGDHP